MSTIYEVAGDRYGYGVVKYDSQWRRDGRDSGIYVSSSRLSYDEAQRLVTKLTDEARYQSAKAVVDSYERTHSVPGRR